MADAKSKTLEKQAIARIAHDLSKAVTDPQTSPNTYSNLLAQLRVGVVASEDTLRQTRIGIVVNKLKDEKIVKDEGVRKEAHDLVNKWKRDIQSKKGGGASPRPAAAAQGKPVANGEKKVEAAVGEKWKSLKPEERGADKDGVNWKVTGSGARDACLKLLYDGLVFKSQEHSPQHVLSVAVSIETQVHKTHAPETSSEYKEKVRSLFSNLKSKESPHLRNAMLATPQLITPEKLVSMSPEELKSPEQVARDNELRAQNKNNAMVGQDEKAISDILTCPQCKQKKVSYSQAQTRSADEPMTTFCDCTVCGRKWKFS